MAPRRVAPLRVVAEDFPKPDKIDKTDNYREGAALSQKFKVRPLTPPPPARAPPHDSIDPSVPSSPPYHVKILPCPDPPTPPRPLRPLRLAIPSSPFHQDLNGLGEKKKVVVVGGGLSGLACAKYLTDAGHEPIVLGARRARR